MADLVLTDLNEAILLHLQRRARGHGRTPVDEAKEIICQALEGGSQSAWDSVDAIYRRLAESGHVFSDSAALVREDRQR